VEICVRDYGIGMPQETKDMLFGKFHSSSVLGTNHEPGTGLGLLLVKDFVAQHNGTIVVESEVGKGTCFRFTVPRDN
jgi:signal transduction histidine kinase